MSERTLSEWFEEARKVSMRHTSALPPCSRWERLHRRILGYYPASVVERRMTALYMDELERKAWLRDNPPVPRV